MPRGAWSGGPHRRGTRRRSVRVCWTWSVCCGVIARKSCNTCRGGWEMTRKWREGGDFRAWRSPEAVEATGRVRIVTLQLNLLLNFSGKLLIKGQVPHDPDQFCATGSRSLGGILD